MDDDEFESTRAFEETIYRLVENPGYDLEEDPDKDDDDDYID